MRVFPANVGQVAEIEYNSDVQTMLWTRKRKDSERNYPDIVKKKKNVSIAFYSGII